MDIEGILLLGKIFNKNRDIKHREPSILNIN